MAFSIDLAGASPAAMQPFLPRSDRALLPKVAAGQGIIGTTESKLRGIGAGGVLQLGSHRVRVAGVVPDPDIGAHELFVSRREAHVLGVGRQRYLLVAPTGGTRWQDLAKRIRALLPTGSLIRIRGPGRAEFLRQADAVLPPVMLKEAFGEFAADPHLLPGAWIRLDPSWEAAHIVRATVPILGSVRCNRALIPMIRAALVRVERRGLSSLVRPNDFGGCFAARMIPGTPDSLSAHSWGAAIDINVSSNLFGNTPHQDGRLVGIFKRLGFTWGGRWLIPDGMHFEFQCFPKGMGPPSVLPCPPGGAIWPPAHP